MSLQKIVKRATLSLLAAFVLLATTGMAGHGAFAEDTSTYALGSTVVTLHEFRSGRGGHTYFAPHSNETTAVAAAKGAARRNGGRVFWLTHGEKARNISFVLGGKKYAVDPNRVFSDAGAAASLRLQGKSFSPEALKAVRGLAAFVLKNLFAGVVVPVVGIHNNTDGAPLSIESYMRAPKSPSCPECGNQAAAAQDAFVNPALDHDDFFFVTGRSSFAVLKKAGFNVALQAWPLQDDGSLSVYCEHSGIPYINVEAQDRHSAQQSKMLLELK